MELEKSGALLESGTYEGKDKENGPGRPGDPLVVEQMKQVTSQRSLQQQEGDRGGQNG